MVLLISVSQVLYCAIDLCMIPDQNLDLLHLGTTLLFSPSSEGVIFGWPQGTLGIFLAATLSERGNKVACVERGKLMGRDQEWNISREDMKVH